MTTLDGLKANLTTGALLDLTDTTTNKQVTQFLTQLSAAANPDVEREEGEALNLTANSGEGSFIVSDEGTSYELDGEAMDEIDLMDLFSLDDIDLSTIDFGDLELDEETLDLIRFLMEDEDVQMFSEEDLNPETAGGDEAVMSAVEEYKAKLAKQLEEMDEMLAIGDLSAQAQKEIQERYSKVQTLRSMESESLLTLMKAMLSINSTLNGMIKSHNDNMERTFKN